MASFVEQADACGNFSRRKRRHLDRYLRCGVLAHGFARVRCGECKHETLVAFSCKGRGICPSCTTRRAHDCANHLVEHVLPRAPYRQWVLTFPFRLRLLFAHRPALLSRSLDVFLRELFGWRRRQARARGIVGRCGAVTFVQHFGSALQLNVHLHIVVPDGLFDETGAFHPLPDPEDTDVERLLLRSARRILSELADTLEDPTLQGELDASLLGAANERGQASFSFAPPPYKRLCARADGFSLHAATRVAAWDRRGLERLCHYGARGAVANSRLSELPDGRYRYELKRPLPGGRTELVLTGARLLQKLTALIPPPRANLTRYHGVFAPGSKLRSRVVPAARPDPRPPRARNTTGTILDVLPRAEPRPRDVSRYRLDWATLLKKVFGVDVLSCERCGGRMRLIAQLTEGPAVRKILRHLGRTDSPLPRSPSRGPPQDELLWS